MMIQNQPAGSGRIWLPLLMVLIAFSTFASSHREAPLISNDPLADNTDLYAFRSPNDINTVTIIANYIPFELPEGGPNYYTFGQNIRYEIHIKNKSTTIPDDITYRFTFNTTNQDPNTFFNIRLGQQNLKTTYTCSRSVDGGITFTNIVTNGIVPPPNIGPRSIENAVGLGTNYNTLIANAIATTAQGEQVFCGPADDPFFADLAGVLDVGSIRPTGLFANPPKDGMARFNVHTIAIKIPISFLQKDGKNPTQASNILDPAFVIGVWASASRPQIKTFNNNTDNYSGSFVQVSRLGMPLTNEVLIPLGLKNKWNTVASNNSESQFQQYFQNPELALYMDDSKFGSSVPALNGLRIQKNSLGSFDFRNGRGGLFSLKGTSAVVGTALDDAIFGNFLLPNNSSPRAVDILPIFYTGVPNLKPYQLATGKSGNILAAGKPFVNNFLPTFGDMLRLNMAVPVTPRSSPDFSSLGLLKAAVLGLTDARFNTNSNLEFIPNMDGFPNGRRLEDDVTTIELQAVAGVVLASIGLWYDDFHGTGTTVTPQMLRVLNFTAGPTSNDTAFKTTFPYVQTPWRGLDHTVKPRF
jgi:hypothetical protein